MELGHGFGVRSVATHTTSQHVRQQTGPTSNEDSSPADTTPNQPNSPSPPNLTSTAGNSLTTSIPTEPRAALAQYDLQSLQNTRRQQFLGNFGNIP